MVLPEEGRIGKYALNEGGGEGFSNFRLNSHSRPY